MWHNTFRGDGRTEAHTSKASEEAFVGEEFRVELSGDGPLEDLRELFLVCIGGSIPKRTNK